MEKKFHCNIDNNDGKVKLSISNRSLFEQFLATIKGDHILTISSLYKARSSQQNKYMYGVVYKMISDQTGYSMEEVHDLMRMMFWSKEVQGVKVPRSTTEFSTIEMEDYLSKIRMFSSQKLGLYIPEPNEEAV